MEFLPPEELKKYTLNFLRDHTVAVLATVSSDGIPQAATLYYDVDADLNFYFMASKDSRKATNLEKNKHVSIVVGFGPAASVVQAGGIAEVSDDLSHELFGKIIERIKLSKIDQLPIVQINKGAFVTIKVKPDWLVWLNLDKEKYPETYHYDFHKVI